MNIEGKEKAVKLVIVTIRIGSVVRNYQRVRKGGCTLLRPPKPGEPVSRSRLVVK